MRAYEKLCQDLGDDSMFLYTLLTTVYEKSFDKTFLATSGALALIQKDSAEERRRCLKRACELDLLIEEFLGTSGVSIIKPGPKLEFFITGKGVGEDEESEAPTPEQLELYARADAIFAKIPADIRAAHHDQLVVIAPYANPDKGVPYIFGTDPREVVRAARAQFGLTSMSLRYMGTPNGAIPKKILRQMGYTG